MQRHSFAILGVLLAGALAGLAACSGGSPRSAGGAIPTVAGSLSAVPFAAATPPVTAPVTIPYPYTNSWKTTTWAGPTAKPVTRPGRDDGTTTVQFTVDKKTGVYLVPETIVSKTGYTEVLDSAITFPAYKRGTAQIILSDNFTFVQGPFSQSGLDTYPQTQNSFDFPLTKGRTWSAAAAHNSSSTQSQTGSGAFLENDALYESANGEYTDQSQFSSTSGSANQDNYASTTLVQLANPSVYTLAEPAAGYNQLTQTFNLPNGKRIAVVTSGKKPLPYKAGTARVPNWYPGGGALPGTLYADNYSVTGTATMPSTCGKWKGQSASVVLESYSDLDPVEGTYDTSNTTYYLTSLAKGQYWFACIVSAYTNTSYANGLAGGSGAWGKPSSQQVGTEILVASGAKPSVRDLSAIPAMHVLALRTPQAIRERIGLATARH